MTCPAYRRPAKSAVPGKGEAFQHTLYRNEHILATIYHTPKNKIPLCALESFLWNGHGIGITQRNLGGVVMETNDVNTAKRAFLTSVLQQHRDTHSKVAMATVTKETSLTWRASGGLHN